MSKEEDITKILEKLSEKHDEIKAVMVAREGLEGYIVFPENFKNEVIDIWEPLSQNLNEMLSMISKYSFVGMKKSYTEIAGYGVFFYVLEESDTAIMTFLKADNSLEKIIKLKQEIIDAGREIIRLVVDSR